MQQEAAHFRVYQNLEESFDDFVGFITENSRYHGAQDIDGDSEAFIRALHQAGYATDPEYPEKVLQVYDQVKNLVGSAAKTALQVDKQDSVHDR